MPNRSWSMDLGEPVDVSEYRYRLTFDPYTGNIFNDCVATLKEFYAGDFASFVYCMKAYRKLSEEDTRALWAILLKLRACYELRDIKEDAADDQKVVIMDDAWVIEACYYDALLMCNACELFVRMDMGQLEEWRSWFKILDYEKLMEWEQPIKESVCTLLHGNGQDDKSYRCEEANVAWDIHQRMRYRLYWDKYPKGGMQVWFDEPLKTSEKCEFAIERIQE